MLLLQPLTRGMHSNCRETNKFTSPSMSWLEHSRAGAGGLAVLAVAAKLAAARILLALVDGQADACAGVAAQLHTTTYVSKIFLTQIDYCSLTCTNCRALQVVHPQTMRKAHFGFNSYFATQDIISACLPLSGDKMGLLRTGINLLLRSHCVCELGGAA